MAYRYVLYTCAYVWSAPPHLIRSFLFLAAYFLHRNERERGGEGGGGVSGGSAAGAHQQRAAAARHVGSGFCCDIRFGGVVLRTVFLRGTEIISMS